MTILAALLLALGLSETPTPAARAQYDAGNYKDAYDGLRVLVQSYVAWQVPDDPQRVRQFLRSVRNQPDEAARQLRSFVNADLHVISSNYDLADLVNMDPQKVRLDAVEDQLHFSKSDFITAVRWWRDWRASTGIRSA